MDAAEMGVDLTAKNEVLEVYDPPPRKEGIVVESVDELVDKLKNEVLTLKKRKGKADEDKNEQELRELQQQVEQLRKDAQAISGASWLKEQSSSYVESVSRTVKKIRQFTDKFGEYEMPRKEITVPSTS